MNKAVASGTNPVTWLVRRIAADLAECSYAQRRMLQLQTAPDRYVTDPDAAPENYDEFLFRTSGVLEHEASARARAHSRR